MISNKKSSKNYFQKLCQALLLKVKGMSSIAGVQQLTIEFKCTVLQIKLISYTVANTISNNILKLSLISLLCVPANSPLVFSWQT